MLQNSHICTLNCHYMLQIKYKQIQTEFQYPSLRRFCVYFQAYLIIFFIFVLSRLKLDCKGSSLNFIYFLFCFCVFFLFGCFFHFLETACGFSTNGWCLTNHINFRLVRHQPIGKNNSSEKIEQ